MLKVLHKSITCVSGRESRSEYSVLHKNDKIIATINNQHTYHLSWSQPLKVCPAHGHSRSRLQSSALSYQNYHVCRQMPQDRAKAESSPYLLALPLHGYHSLLPALLKIIHEEIMGSHIFMYFRRKKQDIIYGI